MEKCPKHKDYKAVRKPKVNCAACWRMYSAKQKGTKQYASDRTVGK